MNGNDILIDSNILVYYMTGHENVKSYFNDFRPVLSFITELEVLSGSYLHPNQSGITEIFLAQYTVIDYLPAFKDIIVNLRRQKKLKIPDAIIAATAIYLEVPLVSADKGFNNIPGLDLILHDPANF